MFFILIFDSCNLACDFVSMKLSVPYATARNESNRWLWFGFMSWFEDAVGRLAGTQDRSEWLRDTKGAERRIN